jgi:hypothetical protein
MKTKDKETPKAPALLSWEVAKVPEGAGSLKVGAVRCAVGAQLRLTQEAADTLNAALPGCLVFQGI